MDAAKRFPRSRLIALITVIALLFSIAGIITTLHYGRRTDKSSKALLKASLDEIRKRGEQELWAVLSMRKQLPVNWKIYINRARIGALGDMFLVMDGGKYKTSETKGESALTPDDKVKISSFIKKQQIKKYPELLATLLLHFGTQEIGELAYHNRISTQMMVGIIDGYIARVLPIDYSMDIRIE